MAFLGQYQTLVIQLAIMKEEIALEICDIREFYAFSWWCFFFCDFQRDEKQDQKRKKKM